MVLPLLGGAELMAGEGQLFSLPLQGRHLGHDGVLLRHRDKSVENTFHQKDLKEKSIGYANLPYHMVP